MTTTSSANAPVAIVTGGARGIGLAIGQWFVARGHRIALLDIDHETLQRSVAAFDRPDAVLAVHADVRDPAQVAAGIAQVVAKFGRVDKLVNNAGIRVNAICPGPVETEMAKLVHSVAIRSDYQDAIPLGRYGTPEEMANTVGFLCSDDASFINGQFLAVDGGFDAAGVGLPTLRRNASAAAAK